MDPSESFLASRRAEIGTTDPTVPLAFADLERAAAASLSEDVFAFATSGAGTGETARENRDGFADWRIAPRVFRDVSERRLAVELFGRPVSGPLFLSPIGIQSVFHEEGELATARAADSLDIPFSLSAASSRTIEAVGDVAGDAPQFFQLYWTEDWDLTASLLERAERSGYDAILVTADYQIPRWMPATLGSGGDFEATLANLESDGAADESDRRGQRIRRDQSVTWDDLAFLRDHTTLPIVVKGIMRADDARLAIDHGADGVFVSNHGGRQVDGGLAAIRALPSVVDEVDGAVPVLFDGGVRNGANVFKALALGADAVGLGRSYVYGLALGGERGVYEVAHNVLAELESVLGLAGYDDVTDLDRTALTTT